MTPTQKREVVKFTPNVPVEVALKFAGQGTITSTRFGERVLYTLTDDRVMFLDLGVAQKVNELGVNVHEKFSICRLGKGRGWTVWLSPETERARAAAEGVQVRPSEEEIQLDEQLKIPVRSVQDMRAGLAESKTQGFLVGSRDGEANGTTNHSTRSETERRERTMELNGNAAAGALTPATVEVVTDDHSNTHKVIRNQCPPSAELRVAVEEISRFMPVMDIEQALKRRMAIVDATQKLMHPGVDFGKVPGTDRDVLLQPGADKLCNLFGLVIQYEVAKSEEDWTGEGHGGTPFFFYEVRGRAYRGDFLMGEGVGSCNSWESVYRWRKAERICPQCGKANIRKSKRDGGWYCWTKTEGCGAQFEAGDPVIESQEAGRKENPDIPDAVNTVLKMAYKRCKVSTTINATSASEFFTQDVEDAALFGRNVDGATHAPGIRDAREFVRDRKPEELRLPLTTSVELAQQAKPWKNYGEMRQVFDRLREQVGETCYQAELKRAGVQNPAQFQSPTKALACYESLVRIAAQPEVA